MSQRTHTVLGLLPARLIKLRSPALAFLAGTIDFAMRSFLDTTHIGFLSAPLLLGLTLCSLQLAVQILHLCQGFAPLANQLLTLLTQVFDLRQTLIQQQLQVGQPHLCSLAAGHRLGRLLAILGGLLASLVFYGRDALALRRRLAPG